MSGKHFVAALKRIGYPDADELGEHGFDWMFDSEEFLPFLQWFCDEIHSTNVLDPFELDEFKKLELSKESILKGESLEKALQNLALFEKDILEVPDNRLQEEITFLKEELFYAKRQKEILTQQYNKLVMHETSLLDHLAKISVVDEAEQLEYRNSLELIQLNNSKMNSALEAMMPAVNQLTDIYRESGAGTDMERKNKSHVFLSYMDFNPYYKAEEQYTRALTAFTKKKFFNGIAEMAGQNEGSSYDFLEIIHPDLIFVKGEREEANLDDCKELARIQAFYPLNESKRINAITEECRIATGCKFYERMLTELKDQPYPNDIAQLGSRLKTAQNHMNIVNKEISQLAEQLIPTLIKESASLQTAKILRGDYDLKIARQDYFTSNQDQMIKHLVTKRARSEFLCMLLEMESRNHREMQRHLLAVNMILKQMLTVHQNRMKMLSEIEDSSNQLQRMTVDSRDKFLHHFNQTLDLGSSEIERQQKKLFTTYEDLEQKANKLVQQVVGTTLHALRQKEEDEVAVLEQDLVTCEALLCPDSSLSRGIPMLSPPVLLDAMSRLNGLLNNLEEAVMDIMKDVNNKKKTLQSDSLVAVERELFAYFFTDANRLRRVVEEINSRLQLLKSQ